MKNKYTSPEIEILLIDKSQILTESGGNPFELPDYEFKLPSKSQML